MHFELLKLLADGKFHSGEDLATMLEVSRTSIWNMVSKIEKLGLELHSVKGKGYKLLEPLNLLEQEKIFKFIPADSKEKIQDLQIFQSIASTSTHVMELSRKGELSLSEKKIFVCIAEQQTAGKGRRGRPWVSPYGHNLYFTIAREFNAGISELEGLSLVIALAVTRVLGRKQVQGLGIKWPNDILWQGKKLAGILLEISGDPTGLSQVLIGLGLNVSANPDSMVDVDQAWVDLKTISGNVPDRNEVMADLIVEIAKVIDEFEEKGFTTFKSEWDNNDALRNQEVELKTHSNQPTGIVGKVLGVNNQGALLLQTKDGEETFHGGELSPRIVEKKQGQENQVQGRQEKGSESL
ncbi:MAG: biotin--[acetyl-CoA-carboxylase] ligase [Gammaproteobacteria bacterium]|jgi:BirA family transcriptional regulator, biotin operon repressor / biotin---[acetyl-CoA-carboxylase] ligase|nr:biotin--[acetyl-CoA-carboxylase] ligase [Gammaproteobacteria bacterium]